MNFETKPLLHTQHLMRCMLTSNLAVDQRFANGTHLVVRVIVFCGSGTETKHRMTQRREPETDRTRACLCVHLRTQGRLLHWCPPEAAAEGSKKALAVPASHPSLCARFVKETAVQKRTALLPDIDMIDCAVRQENLNFAGQPIMLQLPLVPAYALTVHKTQVLARAVRDACMRVDMLFP